MDICRVLDNNKRAMQADAVIRGTCVHGEDISSLRDI